MCAQFLFSCWTAAGEGKEASSKKQVLFPTNLLRTLFLSLLERRECLERKERTKKCSLQQTYSKVDSRAGARILDNFVAFPILVTANRAH